MTQRSTPRAGCEVQVYDEGKKAEQEKKKEPQCEGRFVSALAQAQGRTRQVEISVSSTQRQRGRMCKCTVKAKWAKIKS